MRIRALPPDAPLWSAIEAEQQQAAEQQQLRELDNVLDMFKPKEG